MTIEDLQETAALAHLNLNEKELAAAFPAFEQMLGYFAAMQAADEDLAAFGQSADKKSAVLTGASHHSRAVSSGFFRPDGAVNTSGSTVNTENLIGNAGERDGQFLVIPNVL